SSMAATMMRTSRVRAGTPRSKSLACRSRYTLRRSADLRLSTTIGLKYGWAIPTRNGWLDQNGLPCSEKGRTGTRSLTFVTAPVSPNGRGGRAGRGVIGVGSGGGGTGALSPRRLPPLSPPASAGDRAIVSADAGLGSLTRRQVALP